MNRNKFSSLFQDTMGVSFSKFALRYRLNSASRALRQTRDTIETIAFEWGFNDISHFNKVFVNHYGITPGEYRNKE
ncbi:MAG: helix-turn-helix transcriptional regulator [Bacteroidales bacterium]|nr:helix-turn-helix transcriptional regulator [Bacteroidales bacterium]